MSNSVIAIDGPAASGKSTTAGEVARRLHFVHVNSGLFYRAITWAALREGWMDDQAVLRREVARLEIEPVVDGGSLEARVMGELPRSELQSRSVSALVSAVSANDFVRTRVLELLRATAEKAHVVCDGRDIGSVVFPEAALKIFLVADVEERARRRLLDYGGSLSAAAVAEEAERLAERDRADSTREVAPLIQAPDAVEIDTTHLTREAVIDRILQLAEGRGITPPQG